MPVYLDVQGTHKNARAGRAMQAYGVKDAKLLRAVWELDNTDPENISVGFLPGSEIRDCIGALYELAQFSGHKVSASANGLSFIVEPLEWQRKANTKRVERSMSESYAA